MISQRLRGVKEDGEAMEADFMPKLQKAFGDAGVDIEDANGELRSTYDILNDLHGVWDSLGSMQKQFLGEKAAGNRQVKVLNAIMANWDVVEETIQNASNAMGAATEGNEKFMNSIEGRLTAFKSAFQELSINTLESDFVGGLTDTGTAILNFVNSIGGAAPVIKTLAGAFMAFNGIKIADSFAKFFTAIPKIISTGGFGGLISEIGIAVAALTVLDKIGQYNTIESKLGRAKSGYANATSNIQSLQDRLSGVQSQIATLQSKGTLTFVEQQELTKLQQVSSELQTQIELQKQSAQMYKQQQERGLLDLANNYEKGSTGSFIEDAKNLGLKSLSGWGLLGQYIKTKSQQSSANFAGKEFDFEKEFRQNVQGAGLLNNGRSDKDLFNQGLSQFYENYLPKQKDQQDMQNNLLNALRKGDPIKRLKDFTEKEKKNYQEYTDGLNEYGLLSSNGLLDAQKVYSKYLEYLDGMEENDLTHPLFEIARQQEADINKAMDEYAQTYQSQGEYIRQLLDIDNYDNVEGVDGVADKLINLARAGKLTSQSFGEGSGFENFIELCNLAGISATEAAAHINGMYNTIENMPEEPSTYVGAMLEAYIPTLSESVSTMFGGGTIKDETTSFELLQKAMSEVNSTGKVSATIWSELITRDKEFANVLKLTADGYTINTDAYYDYLEAQSKGDRVNAFKGWVDAYKRLQDAEKAQEHLRQLGGEELALTVDTSSITAEVEQWSALIRQIDSATNALARYQGAKANPNSDANFNIGKDAGDTITGALKSGKIGTDEVKSAADYILGEGWEKRVDEDGNLVYSTFQDGLKSAQEKYKRYFSNDDEKTSLKNFYSDLKKNGFGDYDSSGFFQLFDTTADGEVVDLESMSKAVGLTKGVLQDLFGLANTYRPEEFKFEFPDIITDEDLAQFEKITKAEEAMQAIEQIEQRIEELKQRKGEIDKLLHGENAPQEGSEEYTGLQEELDGITTQTEQLTQAKEALEKTLEGYDLEGLDGEDGIQLLKDLLETKQELEENGIQIPVTLLDETGAVKQLLEALGYDTSGWENKGDVPENPMPVAHDEPLEEPNETQDDKNKKHEEKGEKKTEAQDKKQWLPEGWVEGDKTELPGSSFTDSNIEAENVEVNTGESTPDIFGMPTVSDEPINQTSNSLPEEDLRPAEPFNWEPANKSTETNVDAKSVNVEADTIDNELPTLTPEQLVAQNKQHARDLSETEQIGEDNPANAVFLDDNGSVPITTNDPLEVTSTDDEQTLWEDIVPEATGQELDSEDVFQDVPDKFGKYLGDALYAAEEAERQRREEENEPHDFDQDLQDTIDEDIRQREQWEQNHPGEMYPVDEMREADEAIRALQRQQAEETVGQKTSDDYTEPGTESENKSFWQGLSDLLIPPAHGEEYEFGNADYNTPVPVTAETPLEVEPQGTEGTGQWLPEGWVAGDNTGVANASSFETTSGAVEPQESVEVPLVAGELDTSNVPAQLDSNPVEVPSEIEEPDTSNLTADLSGESVTIEAEVEPNTENLDSGLSGVEGTTIEVDVNANTSGVQEQVDGAVPETEQVTIEGDASGLSEQVDGAVPESENIEITGDTGTLEGQVEAAIPDSKDVTVNAVSGGEGATPEDGVINYTIQLDSSAVDNYSPEDKTATVKYSTDTTEPDGYTPTGVESTVTFTAETSGPDGYTPGDKKATVNYSADTSAPDSYSPQDQSATVTYGLDSSAPDGYQPSDKSATATYGLEASAPNSYQPPDKNANVHYGVDASAINSWTPPIKKGQVVYSASGGADNHSHTGSSGGFAKGTTHAPRGESLVDEKGAELIEHVKAGTYELGTNNGPRMTHLDSGDVVHTAKETKEILSRVAKFGGFFRDGLNKTKSIVGKAFASGTVSKSSSKKETDPFTEWSSSLFDWAEIRLERLSDKIQSFLDKTTNAVKYATKNGYINKALSTIKTDLTATNKAYKLYIKQANKAASKGGLSKGIINRIKNGSINISEYDDKMQARIKEYKKWYDLAQKCKTSLIDLKNQQRELAEQRIDNIIEYYENRTNRNEDLIKQREATRELRNSQGIEVKASDYNKEIEYTKKQIDIFVLERKKIQNSLNSALNKKYIKKGSTEYYKYLAEIQKLTTEITNAEIKLIEFQDTINAIDLTNLGWELDALTNSLDNMEDFMNLHAAQSIDETAFAYKDLIKNGMDQIQNLEEQNKKYAQQQKGLDVLSEKYQKLQKEIDNNNHSIMQIKVSQEKWNDAIVDLKIDKLKEYEKELKKTNDQYKDQKKLQEALNDLEKARSQRTQRVFVDGVGFVYQADQDKIKSTQERLEDILEDQVMSKIDDIVDALEEIKEGNNIYDANGHLLGQSYTIPQLGTLSEILADYYNADSIFGTMDDLKRKVLNQVIDGATSTSTTFTFGDINLSEVNDADTLAKALVDQLPNALLQAIYKRQ